MIKVKTTKDTYIVVNEQTIVEGKLPPNQKHNKCVYTVINHELDRNSINIVSCDTTDIIVYSNKSQQIKIRWVLIDI